MRTARRLTNRAGGRESGAALVEFAIILPLLLYLVFGIVEFGLFFRDYLTVANTTRTGARVGSSAGATADADYRILQSLKSAASALPSGANSIDGISVFKASAVSSALPNSSCTTGSVSGVCNFYTAADLNRPQTDFGCGVGDRDLAWCPTGRSDSQSAGTDYVGVWIKTTHGFVTRLYGPSRTITDSVVMRIEPKRS
jgi:hypothetical protein